MKIVDIKCPNCKAALKVNPEKDTVMCGYCHTEFKVDDEIKRVEINKTIHHIYTDDAKLKQIEFQEKKEEQKNKTKRIKAKYEHIGTILIIIIVILLFGFGHGYFDTEEKKSIMQENELQQIVEEVKEEVKNGNFEEAYLKAKTINYTEGWSSKIEEKWKNTRKEMIDYVIREEKKATGKSEHKSESNLWDKVFK